MATENMVRVYAPIEVQKKVAASAMEKASDFLAFPEERQQDLKYIKSVLVSAGTNKNGAHFLPSEMLKAHPTIVNKAIDLEHEEDKIIGHIYDCAYLFKDGQQFDPVETMMEYKAAARDLEQLDIDIAIAGVIHKMRFPEIAEEISSGEWKVSMECFFKDFDIKIGDTIITRDEALSLGYDPSELIGGFVSVVAGRKALGKHLVSRVLRDITFSGMGLVKNPANPHSIILETAEHRKLMETGNQVVDLERIDSLRGHQVELSELKEEKSAGDKEAEMAEDLVEVNIDPQEEAIEEQPRFYLELDTDTRGVKRVLTVSPNQEVATRWDGGGLPGPGSVESQLDGICKSFKKRVTKYNALDQSEGQVIQEHWCALFEEPCPVIGASAKAPECLRNQRNAVTRDPKQTLTTKTVREHLDHGPGNSFVTVISPDFINALPLHPDQPQAMASEERKAQAVRIKQTAQSLRNSMKEYILNTEKKTSE